MVEIFLEQATRVLMLHSGLLNDVLCTISGHIKFLCKNISRGHILLGCREGLFWWYGMVPCQCSSIILGAVFLFPPLLLYGRTHHSFLTTTSLERKSSYACCCVIKQSCCFCHLEDVQLMLLFFVGVATRLVFKILPSPNLWWSIYKI